MNMASSWERAKPLLEQALEHAHGTHLIDDVAQGLTEGKLQLWLGEESAAVTEVLNFPRLRAINVFLSAGRIDELKACLPGIKAWARAVGCTRIMFAGRLDLVDGRRSGWEGLLPGFDPNHILLSMEL